MKQKNSDQFSRQSFLGENSQELIQQTRIGIVGLGGGGSHIAQQLAHVGFLDFLLFDNDEIEDTNLNRLVGATQEDVDTRNLKVNILERLIISIRPNARVGKVDFRWQDRAGLLKKCDVVFGCVDSFQARNELEIFCRRFLIPYIDIGMDVLKVEDEDPRMVGQVIVSLPGEVCMWCMSFLTEQKIQREVEKYGDAGGRPQVVWANGILASAAVGIWLQLLTGWSESFGTPIYLSYDGNRSLLNTHIQLKYPIESPCPHFSLVNIGEPSLKKL